MTPDPDIEEDAETDPQRADLRWLPLSPLERSVRWCVGLLVGILATLIVTAVVVVASLLRPVTVANVVEVASPREASLYGYCSADGDTYTVSVVALAGGVEMTAAKGDYTEGAASSVALEISDWFGTGGPLDFGPESEDCAHLDGWD